VVGPQLDGAGNRGLERLCEDILDPNRDVDPAFHLRILTLKNGQVQAGMQRRIEGESIVMADATARESTIAKSDVAKEEIVPMSLMPAAFSESIPEADFRNLLAWLLGLKEGKP
jgi:putative heme-binding domain-containing protein